MNTQQEELPADTRQVPARTDIVRWLDQDWRDQWLRGFSDEDLDQMSVFDKAYRLRNYVSRGSVEYYGEFAVWYMAAVNFLKSAYVSHDKFTDHELFRIGHQLTKKKGKK